jgi:hypothetical protein
MDSYTNSSSLLECSHHLPGETKLKTENGKTDWSVEVESIDWTRTNADIAQEYGVSEMWICMIRRDHQIPKRSDLLLKKIRERLGIIPDSHLADEIEVSSGTVARWRRKLGISAASYTKHDWNEVDEIIGTVPDKLVSEKTGIPISTVGDRRRSLQKAV